MQICIIGDEQDGGSVTKKDLPLGRGGAEGKSMVKKA